MELLISYPISDLRCLYGDRWGMNSRPRWPRGVTNLAAHRLDFLPYFGALRETKADITSAWGARRQHVDATNIKLAENFPQYFRDSFSRAPALQGECGNARLVRKHFFGSATEPRSFCEIKIEVQRCNFVISKNNLREFLNAVAQIQLHIRRDQQSYALKEFKERLVSMYLNATTGKGRCPAMPVDLVLPGRPICVISDVSVNLETDDLDVYSAGEVDSGLEGLYWVEVEGVDYWFIADNFDVRKARQFELFLARMQAERCGLDGVVRVMDAISSQPQLENLINVDAMSNYVESALGNINTTRVARIDVSILRGLMRSDRLFHAQDWELLDSDLLDLRDQAKRDIEIITKATQGVASVVFVGRNEGVLGVNTGDSISVGDGSNVVNRSDVQGDVIASAQSGAVDYKWLAETIRSQAALTENDQVTSVAGELAQELEGEKRPHRISELWDRLVEATPLFTAIPAIVTSIGKIVGS